MRELSPSSPNILMLQAQFLLVFSLVTDACDAAETAVGIVFHTCLVIVLSKEESHIFASNGTKYPPVPPAGEG